MNTRLDIRGPKFRLSNIDFLSVVDVMEGFCDVAEDFGGHRNVLWR